MSSESLVRLVFKTAKDPQMIELTLSDDKAVVCVTVVLTEQLCKNHLLVNG